MIGKTAVIESIRLKNCQKFKDKFIEFSPGVTCLIGDSGSGKSTVLRMLRWIALNKPNNDSIIRHGKDQASVELVVDGKGIGRKKGKAKNEYVLECIREKQNRKRIDTSASKKTQGRAFEYGAQDNSNREGRIFKAFGTEPPQPIQEIFNVGETNFQKQLDAPFWFDLTPGQVAKELNGVVDLEVIDKVLGELAAGLRKAKAGLEVGQQRHLEAKDKRESLRWVEEMDADLRKVEEAEGEWNATVREIERTTQAVCDVERIAKEREGIGDKLDELEKVVEAGEAWSAVFENHLDLKDSIAELEEMEEEECRIDERLAELEKRTSQFSQCPLCGQKTK